MLPSNSKKYWFRPARFWYWFVFYYPSSFAGWVVTVIILLIACWTFYTIDSRSHSVSDTLINLAPWVIAVMAVFDLLCFRRGKYPSWRQKPDKA